MKKGIIFDVDGTLWDACRVIAASWEEYVRRFEPSYSIEGHSITEETARHACGQTMDIFADRMLPNIPAPYRYEVSERCCAYEVEYLKTHSGEIYPDVVSTMRALAKTYHLYIVSNCQVGYIQDFLLHSGTGDIVEDTLDFGTTGKGKEVNLRILAERNRLDRAVYVGDTAGDYQSTRKAGMPFIYASYGFGEVTGPVPRIDAFAQLPEVAERILSSSEEAG